MSARDTLISLAEQYARLETALAEAERKQTEDAAEIRILRKLCEQYQPEACRAFGCLLLVPTAAQLAQLRALGNISWDPAREFAWQQGWCSAECSERDNVVPFVRQTEAP